MTQVISNQEAIRHGERTGGGGTDSLDNAFIEDGVLVTQALERNLRGKLFYVGPADNAAQTVATVWPYRSLHPHPYRPGHLARLLDVGPFAEDFHVYAIEWEPQEIRWYVDDVLFNTITHDDLPGDWVYATPFSSSSMLLWAADGPAIPTAQRSSPSEYWSIMFASTSGWLSDQLCLSPPS